LDDYTNKSNLHIAITDSTGEVVEFDRWELLVTSLQYIWIKQFELFLNGHMYVIFCAGMDSERTGQ
jgi:hypothetical protein